ncbi:hypothetical protein ABN028_19305 [Actinopolymorpha sp. B17G11]|uniref:hypothetical protein n=1 Tax=Actinopolymorpha sp. B17G11 TaxID=3160861 RepID=UPI0032E3AFA4
MTTPSTDQLRIFRDVAGLVLALSGLIGLGVVAFVVHPLFGCTVLSLMAVGVGGWLATGKA